jgi:hypothetical protein
LAQQGFALLLPLLLEPELGFAALLLLPLLLLLLEPELGFAALLLLLEPELSFAALLSATISCCM